MKTGIEDLESINAFAKRPWCPWKINALRNRCKSGSLPAVKIGGRYFVSPNAIKSHIYQSGNKKFKQSVA